MIWHQVYNPLGNLGISALVAAIPVVVLLGLLGFTHCKAHYAALAGLAAAVLVAALAYRMPLPLVATSAGYGIAFGLFPIGWIVLNAIFIYDITVALGQFEIMKRSIASLASDRRLQTLFIAFSFGAFIEGAAGFGTPVAISAAMLIGLGFRPLQAAGLALLGNTAPVAFGALGSPLIALAKVTGLDLLQLSSMVGRQLPLFSLIVPFWLVVVLAGWRGLRDIWPACLVAGGSFGLAQFVVSNYHGPWLVDIIGAGVSVVALLVLLRFWQPKTAWRLPHEQALPIETVVPPTRREAWVAWMPWGLLSLLVFLWGLPAVKDALNAFSTVKYPIPLLDGAVFRIPPVVPQPKAEEAVFVFNALSATGTALLLAAVLSGLFLGLRPQALVRLYGQTIWRVRWSLLTIALMLALGFTTRYSGSDTTMGLAFASTGVLFPFFSPLLGWLGVALTGSDTSSNVLFGNLQQVSAQQVGISPVLACASNSSGGVMGKMIDAQSIVVASVATGGDTALRPETDAPALPRDILRFVFPHSLALAVLVGLLVLFQAYVFPQIVPSPKPQPSAVQSQS
jgi:lactate permease